MKLFRLLLVALLFSCSDDSTETPETGDPKPIFVEMVATIFLDMITQKILMKKRKD